MMNMAAMGGMRPGFSPQMGNPMAAGAMGATNPAMAGIGGAAGAGNSLGLPPQAFTGGGVGALLDQANALVQSTMMMFGGMPLEQVAANLGMQKQASQQAGLGGAGGAGGDLGGASSLGGMLNKLA